MQNPEDRLEWMLLLLLNMQMASSLRNVRFRAIAIPVIRWIVSKSPDLLTNLNIPKLKLTMEHELTKDLKIISKKKKIKPGLIKVNGNEYLVESTSNVKHSLNFAITANRKLKGYVIRRNLGTLSDCYHKELRCFSKQEKLEMINDIIGCMEQIQFTGQPHGSICLNTWLVEDTTPMKLKLTPPANKVY